MAPQLGEAAYLLLAIVGVYYFLPNNFCRPAYKNIRLLSLLTLGFYLVALASVLVSDNLSAGLDKLYGLREFLAAPFVGLALLGTPVGTRFLMLTVKLAALLVFIVALSQYLTGTGRPGGAVNPLVFALPSLLLGIFSIIRFPLESRREKLLSLIAFSSGCMASVIAQSRTAWIASFFLFAGVLFVWHRTGHLTKHLAMGTTALFLALALVSLQTPIVQQRISSALNEYQSFRVSGEWDSSVGQRIVIWGGGLSAAMKKPAFGWGLHQTQAAAASAPLTPEQRQVILSHNHLHNEYLTNLVAKGLPGLLSLLLMLFVPLAIFLRSSALPDLLVYNGIGALLCIGYALSGLTNQAFGDDTLNTFFIFFLAIALPRCRFTRRHPNPTNTSPFTADLHPIAGLKICPPATITAKEKMRVSRSKHP